MGSKKKVCLDSGHGFNTKLGQGDTGAVNGRHREDVYALAITKKVGVMLEERGYDIVYTRDGDYFVTLQGRCDISNRADANLFISVHCNSASNSSAYGVETFTYTKVDETTKRLAKAIQKYVVRYTGDRDRGVKSSDFYILRKTKAKAVLVEVGFISHDPTAEKLATDEYQNKIAEGIADGVIELFG